MEFYQYPKCGTCKKAAKFLVEKGCTFTSHYIAEEKTTIEQQLVYM